MMTHPSAHTPTPAHSASTPFWSVQTFTFLNSTGTYIVTNGVFFVTTAAYKFDRDDNFKLGLATGVVYLVSAALASQTTSLWRRFGGNSRNLLAWLMIALATLCALPWAAQASGFGTETLAGRSVIWAVVLCYNAITGLLWPVIESYVAGGRSGHHLRRVMGLWNFCWSAALVAGAVLLYFLLERAPTAAIASMSFAHLAAILVLAAHPQEPPAHPHEDSPPPPGYDALLRAFRGLMPMGYLVMTALTPQLPQLFKAHGVEGRGAVLAGLSWIIARVVTFYTLGVWGAWHGKWSAAWIGAALIVGGFGAAVLSPLAPSGGLLFCTAGLVAFGVGMSTIYSGAIYYAMEVHKAEVDAGGGHETAVGLGYTIGPAIGLLASLASGWAFKTPEAAEVRFAPVLFALVGALSLIWVLFIMRQHSGGAPHDSRNPEVPDRSK